jgi:hypothetical protein
MFVLARLEFVDMISDNLFAANDITRHMAAVSAMGRFICEPIDTGNIGPNHRLSCLHLSKAFALKLKQYPAMRMSTPTSIRGRLLAYLLSPSSKGAQASFQNN